MINKQEKWRQQLHLEPPQGWMNDPNGLCFFGGFYHVYFQYAPDNADGSTLKCWGHYQSPDLLHWEFTGTVLFPDSADDKDGVYSGSAIVCDDTLHLFYTGNVKEDGEHDYVQSGRGANVIHVSTQDGVTMSSKHTVLRNSDYPDFCSCHVRDPKIWYERGKWQMVLGARTRNDEGCVLFYSSEDLDHWTYERMDQISEFGYMWECPDVFALDAHRYLSVSPQGLPHQELYYQNVYQSGYFFYDKELTSFTEWDMGFDFYAPQTFEAPDGRRILIGWMGIGDIPYFNPTTALGFQHCLTLPREITRDTDGLLRQNPIRELQTLRKEHSVLQDGSSTLLALPFELTADIGQNFTLTLNDACELSWQHDLFRMAFTEESIGGGRTVRTAALPDCTNLRLIADKSSIELYLNDGRKVFSSRIYPDSDTMKVTLQGLSANSYLL